jgi:MFS superfamily sulfate permease-like transporter
MTAVVVRSWTNVQAGARTRSASILHGVLLLIAALALAPLLNHIPLAALAVVLVVVGFKLTPPKLYREFWHMGREQFLPFIGTVIAVLSTDLLTGPLLGITFALFFIVWTQYSSAIVVTDDDKYRLIRFVSSVSFLHKARLIAAFETVPSGSHVILDGTRAHKIDADIMEAISDFQIRAHKRGIQFSVQRSQSALHSYFREQTSVT